MSIPARIDPQLSSQFDGSIPPAQRTPLLIPIPTPPTSKPIQTLPISVPTSSVRPSDLPYYVRSGFERDYAQVPNNNPDYVISTPPSPISGSGYTPPSYRLAVPGITPTPKLPEALPEAIPLPSQEGMILTGYTPYPQ